MRLLIRLYIAVVIVQCFMGSVLFDCGADLLYEQPHYRITAAVLDVYEGEKKIAIEIIRVGKRIKAGYYGELSAHKYKEGERLTVSYFPEEKRVKIRKNNIVEGVMTQIISGEEYKFVYGYLRVLGKDKKDYEFQKKIKNEVKDYKFSLTGAE